MNLIPIMKAYGRTVSIRNENGWSSGNYQAFIQPLRYKNKMYLNGVNTQIGFNSQGHYLYIGPPDHDLSALEGNTWLLSDNVKYKVDRSEKVYNGDKNYYVWAIIREIVEEESENE